jgi:hypothetical protein
VVTTNYDSLIEQAFASANKPFDLVIHTTDATLGERIYHRAHGDPTLNKVLPRKLLIDLSTRSVVYKIHGSCDAADPAKDQYVITEDDYIDFLSRMVKNTAIPAFCAEPFQRWPFLFIGYRLEDWNLRVVLNRISPTVRLEQGIKSWAIERSPSALEERFWQTRGVNVYHKPIDDFVTETQGVGIHLKGLVAMMAKPSPYKGLMPYDEDDAAFFFGRAQEIRLITANLFAAPQPFSSAQAEWASRPSCVPA